MNMLDFMKVNNLTQSDFARSLGVTQGAVSQWLIRGVPPERVLSLCQESGWQMTPHELRPDIYPNPTDALPNDVMSGDEAAHDERTPSDNEMQAEAS